MAALNPRRKYIYDDDDVGELSGSGDESYVPDTWITTDSPLLIAPETAPGVDALFDDETNLYLYILAAVVGAIVFIFAIIILCVSIRRHAKDKKKILQCDKANLQEVKVQHEATSYTRYQQKQPTQRTNLPGTNLPDARRQTQQQQEGKPSPHHPMMAAVTRPPMS